MERGTLASIPRRIIFLYVAFGAAWIVLSDIAIDFFFSVESARRFHVQTVKGWLFIIVTALVFYVLLNRLKRKSDADQARLQLLQDRFADFADSGSDWFWETGPDDRFTFISDRLHQMTGIDPADFLGRTREQIMAPTTDIRVRQRHREILATRNPFRDFVYALSDKEGRIWHQRISGKPFWGENGEFAGFRGIACDVTETVKSEERLSHLAAIVEATSDLVATFDIAGNVAYLNRAGRRLIGFGDAQSLAGITLAAIHPDDVVGRLVAEAIPSAVDRGAWTGETVLRGGDGRAIPAAQAVMAHKDAAGDVQFFSIVARDLSEQRAMETALRAGEQRYRGIFEASADSLLIFDAKGRLVDVNPAGCKMLGYPRDELIGRHGTDVIDTADHLKFREFLAVLGRDGEFFGSGRHRRKDGSTFPVEIYGASIVLMDVRHNLAVVRDITERQAAEAVLRQAQKMEAVGHLTGGVAHDFNNLLAIILGNSELLLGQFADGSVGPGPAARVLVPGEQPRSLRLVEQIFGAATRGADLTRRLLAFSRRQPLNPQVLSLNSLVAGMSPLLKRTLGSPIEIVEQFEPSVVATLADGNQVESALLNLAVNARDAMPLGGRLTIRTGNLTLGEREAATLGGDVLPGDYVLLAVADTGTGMTEKVRSQAFEPFFTTKPVGKGTGLGLPTIYGFMKQSGGHVAIRSEIGSGTTVELYFPRVHVGASSIADAPRTAAPNIRGNSETVLVVEDDDLVRETTLTMLRGLGYRTLGAADAFAGQALVQTTPGIDLVLTDVVMPGGMDGWDLGQAIAESHPHIPVIFCSGYTENSVLQRASQDARIRLLNKPFRRDDLARAVADALARKASGEDTGLRETARGSISAGESRPLGRAG